MSGQAALAPVVPLHGKHSRQAFALGVPCDARPGLFAPRVEKGAVRSQGQATGSQSVHTRQVISARLSRAVLERAAGARALGHEGNPQSAFQAAIAFTKRTLRVKMVVAPQPGTSISRDGQTAVAQTGAAASPNEMVRAADDLKGRLRSADWTRVSLSGASGTCSDFNTANRTAMLK